jgi:hypothetical protein
VIQILQPTLGGGERVRALGKQRARGVQGESREFGIVKDTISKTVWSNAGTDLGYVVGYSTTTAGDCIALKV